MKTLAMLCGLSLLVACAGIDGEGNEVELTDVEATEEEVAAAPCCAGLVEYYEWQCHYIFGWREVRVGYQEFNCGAPYIEPLQGRTAECRRTAKFPCGISLCDCGSGASGCRPRPTTPCGIWPPPPTEPVTD
jgi:hypothetical protein